MVDLSFSTRLNSLIFHVCVVPERISMQWQPGDNVNRLLDFYYLSYFYFILFAFSHPPYSNLSKLSLRLLCAFAVRLGWFELSPVNISLPALFFYVLWQWIILLGIYCIDLGWIDANYYYIQSLIRVNMSYIDDSTVFLCSYLID